MLITIAVLVVIIIAVGYFAYKKSQAPKRNKKINKPVARFQIKPELSKQTQAPITRTKTQPENDALGINAPEKEVAEETNVSKPRELGELIILHIVAPPNRSYKGYELLQALLSAGLRFGEKKIFHRHETKNGRGPILFSLASMEKPGTFDMQKMGAYECKGLIMFMELNSQVDQQLAFDVMFETLKQLVEDLGGEVWDEQRQRLTIEKVAEWKRKVRAYEESQRVPDLFGNS